MKKFTVPCTFGNQVSPFSIYVGDPKKDSHPLQHQSHWLSKERGGTIPQKVMDSLARLHKLSEENGIPFEDLCVYALEVANAEAGDDDTTEGLGEGIDTDSLTLSDSDDEEDSSISE